MTKKKSIKSFSEALQARVPIVLEHSDNRTIELLNVSKKVFKECVEAVQKIALGLKK